jgi:hypothetical protein
MIIGGEKMKFLSVGELETNSSQVWKELPVQREMVVTSNGKPIGLLSSIDEKNFDQVLAGCRQAKVISALSSIQYESTQNGTDLMSWEEINAEIREARASRKKRI